MTLAGISTAKINWLCWSVMELRIHENRITFLPVNNSWVWRTGFLGRTTHYRVSWLSSTDCSIRNYHEIQLHNLKYSLNKPALCWHSTPAYYYAGIFDVGIMNQATNYKTRILWLLPHYFKEAHHQSVTNSISKTAVENTFWRREIIALFVWQEAIFVRSVSTNWML